MSSAKPTRGEIKQAMQELAVLWKPQALPPGATAAQLEQHRKVLRAALAEAETIKTNCHNCEHFSMDRCELHQADVPQAFQKQEGQCADWRFDGIPF
jgi:hypothetical protein